VSEKNSKNKMTTLSFVVKMKTVKI